MNWVIKAVYPSGGHVVMFAGSPMRFADKQAALDRAEILTAAMKKSGDNSTSYIVVEEGL